MTICLSVLIAATIPVGIADAMSIYWTAGTGDWSTGTNWDSGEPGSSDDAYINNGGTVQITQSGEAADHLYLGSGSGNNGSVDMSAGSLSVDWEYIGRSGTGAFTQSGGTNITGALFLGRYSGSSGTYDLSIGSLSADQELIGQSGTGAFTQSGGTNTVSNNLYLGHWSGGSGTYDLSSGSLSANNEYIGAYYSGTGVFTQSGGTNTVTNDLYLGYEASDSNGTYTINNGELSVGGSMYIGGSGSSEGGTGTVTVSGGQASVANNLKVWGAGTVNLIGGTLTAGTIDNLSGGSFNFTGGTLSVGTFDGDLVNTGGILAPGNSPGMTSVFGDYSQDMDSTLQIEIGGLLAETEFDVLDVAGILNLGGSLDVLLFGGFNPLAGDTFDILNWGSLTGVFDSLIMPSLMGDLFWDTSALYTTGELSVASAAVPEPMTVALLGIGLVGLAGGAVRRRFKRTKQKNNNIRQELQD